MINAGTRLGPYEMVSPIGAGGMGEVYKARDPRLELHLPVSDVATPPLDLFVHWTALLPKN